MIEHEQQTNEDQAVWRLAEQLSAATGVSVESAARNIGTILRSLSLSAEDLRSAQMERELRGRQYVKRTQTMMQILAGVVTRQHVSLWVQQGEDPEDWVRDLLRFGVTEGQLRSYLEIQSLVDIDGESAACVQVVWPR